MITIETKTNGYNDHAAVAMIDIFNRAAEKLFPNCTLEHFYYGDRLDMVTVWIPNGYAHFNITCKRVSLCGFVCQTVDAYNRFSSMTYHDECFNGNLLEIA